MEDKIISPRQNVLNENIVRPREAPKDIGNPWTGLCGCGKCIWREFLYSAW